ncbi:MFS transporter [Mycoplasmopsis gallinacea]|uniref:N5-glutamine S-adenosyl-L-methionine-dependent methyltransferase n=1 Tax=Mycoplasmopsis gallinacea TaxID=29556 RepID=A0A449A3N9_9BACT|nr:MFS transporter [Mycoplasmopsis gallinacea]VEU58838.1 N5-glutamine S-adenosyl-L-methionine-dependent methyltransferase [Mycoplasmopsis gallinacea]
MKTTWKTNLIKYISAISVSSIGSEAFKLGSSLYIYKITGDFWFVTMMYLLIQLPSVIVYLLSSKIINLFKDKTILFVSDIISSLVLFILLIVQFFLSEKLNSNEFSIILIIVSCLLGFIHSYRFIHLKNILYYVAPDEKALSKFNLGNSLSLSISFVLSPIFSLFIYKSLPFYCLVIFNIFTYIASSMFYLSIKTSKLAYIFDKDFNDNINVEKSKKIKFYSWMFILLFSVVIGIILYPKQSGLIQFFKYTEKYEYNEWSFFLTICMSFFGMVGVIIGFIISHFSKSKNYLNPATIILSIATLNIVWIFISLSRNMLVTLVVYIVINSFQQLLFSLALPIFYNISYQIFDKKKFHMQNGISLTIRIVVSSLFIILFTWINNLLSYFWAFLTYSLILLVISLLIYVFYFMLFANKDKYYSNKNIYDRYLEYSKYGLWNSEKNIVSNYFPDREKDFKILDIGCGMGRTTFALKKLYPNSQIDAIDISEEFIQYCNSLKENNRIKFYHQSITSSFKGSRKYDLIIFPFNGFTNIIKEKEIHKTFQNIYKLLKNDGVFILTTHYLYSKPEYENYWKNIVKIDELELFDDKKVLTTTEFGVSISNRFYSVKNIINLANTHNFVVDKMFNRNEEEEPDWVKTISTPVTFYCLKKKGVK